jgi:uncharacterized protein YdaU (DUF1376 family)
MKYPCMPLWVGDFLTDIEHLTPCETSAYFRLVLFYWANGGLPKADDGTSDERAIARIARLDSKAWKRSRPALRALFKVPGTWCHPRIEHELAKVIEKSRVNSANAQRSHQRTLPTYTYTHIKKEKNYENGTRQDSQQAKSSIRAGFLACPEQEEFKRWKDWSFKHNIPLWRELQARELQGRQFDFETQWPPQ